MFPHVNPFVTDMLAAVDIGTELEAALRGECLLCRIGARHPDGSTCKHAAQWAAYHDEVAAKRRASSALNARSTQSSK